MNFLKQLLAKRNGYFIRPGYTPRTQPEYYWVAPDAQRGRVYQPCVYPLAVFLARRAGCTTLIDIGSGNAEKLVRAHPEFHLIGMDFGANLENCRRHYPFGEWVEWDIDHHPPPPLPRRILKQSLLICSDVIEHLASPDRLLLALNQWLKVSPCAILSTPDRDLARGPNDPGPPANSAHVREWNLAELHRLLRHFGLIADYIGYTLNNSVSREKKTILAVLRRKTLRRRTAPRPPDAPSVATLLEKLNENEELASEGVGPII